VPCRSPHLPALLSQPHTLPPGEEGERLRVATFEAVANSFEGGVEVCLDLFVRQAEDLVAEGDQIGVAVLVVDLLLAFLMNPTVELQHEPPIVAIKIRNILSDRYLTAEFETEDLPIAQLLPQHLFGRRGLPAKLLGANESSGSRNRHDRILKFLPPLPEGRV